MSKIKVLYLLLVLNIVALTSSLAETISGNVSYLGMTSTGKFWVWASTVPVKSEGHNPIAISSYTVDNNNVNFNYVLVIPTQFLPNRLYIYAMRDWHPPFVEEFLQGQKQINPLYGDPFGEVPGGIFVNVGENPTNISIIVKDPPQGRITGRIDYYYSGIVPANSVLKIAVGRGEGDWIGGPADYKEISQPSFPYLYELNFLADATDYYIVAILDDFNPATIDPFVKYGPVVISSATGSIATVNLTLPLPPGKISGTIYYEQTVLPFVGILRIVAGDGPPREGWNVVSFQEVSISSFPYNYTLSGIPDGNNFYVSVSLLQIVNNEPILIASGLRGPVEVSPNNNRHAAGIRVDLRLPGGGSGISSNAISGNINYSGVAVGYVYVKVGLGTPSGIYDVKGTFSRYGLGPYQIYNLPNGENYYIEAFLDINNNGLWDAGMMEPYAFVGPIELKGGVYPFIDITLTTAQIELSTITVTIRGKVLTSGLELMGGVLVSLWDTKGDNNPFNDVMIATVISSSYSLSSGENYNYEFLNVNLKASLQNLYYNYKIIASKEGYKKKEFIINFYLYHNNAVYYLSDFIMEIKPQISITNVSIKPLSITPDGDNKDDYITISLRYSVATVEMSYENGATVKFVIDTNKNNQFDPVNYDMFVWDNQNRIFIKKDPNYFVDLSKPLDYSKLEGPITYEEYNRIRASYDTIIESWVDGYRLNVDYQNNKSYADVSFIWEGKDNARQTVKNGVYNARLLVEDTYGDIIYTSATVVSVNSPSVIGYVKNEQGSPIVGAKVHCGGPSAWGETYTNENGSFEVSGLKLNETYRLEVSAEGYVSYVIGEILAKLNPTETDRINVTLKKGVEISGYIILPNPPKSGEIRDNNGYPLYNLWIHLEAQDLSGGAWLWKDIMCPLSDIQVSVSSIPFVIYVKPNTRYRLIAKTQGYVSKDLTIDVGNQKLSVNIELNRAAKIIGFVKFPSDEVVISEILNANPNGVGVGIWASSKDKKYNSNTFVWFSKLEILPGATKQFILDSLAPNTTYTIGIDAPSFARIQRDNIYVSGMERRLTEPIVLSLGVKLVGVIRFGSGVYEKVKDRIQTLSTPQGEVLGLWLSVGLQSQKDYSRRWHSVVASTKSILGIEDCQFSISGIQPGEKYKIFVEGNFDGLEVEDEFIVDIPTTTNIVELSQPIRILIPTGVVKGKIVNKTGKTIDMNKVRVVMIIFDRGGGFITTPNSNGEFVFNNVPTGEGLIWGSEYERKPFEKQGDFFGIPTGNAGMFGITVYAIHGSTVNLGDINLQPASKIEVLLKGPHLLIKDIYMHTTSYLEMIYSGQLHTEGPYGLIRVQPIWLKKIAEEMHKQQLQSGESEDEIMDVKEISIGLDDTIEMVSEDTLKYTFKGAQEGVYSLFAMVGHLPVFRWRQEDTVEKAIIETFTISPVEQIVVLKANETKVIELNVSEGVDIIGSIARPSTAVGREEKIDISLREKFSGKVISVVSVNFDSATKNQTIASFRFSRVPPGDYVLVILSPNYKVYSKTLKITSDLASLTLTTIYLDKGANIVGRLVDVNGNPVVSGVVVECMSVPFIEGSYKNTDMPGLGISAESFSAGVFKLANLPAGTYILKVANKQDVFTNYVHTTKAGIVVPNSPVDVEVGDIVLKPAVEITGKVYDTDGKTPLAGVVVLAYPQDIQLRSGLECRTITNRDGSFKIKGINPSIKLWELKVNPKEQDILQVSAEFKRYTEFVKSYINVTKEEFRTNLKVILSLANAEIKGVVTTQDGGSLLLPFEVPGISVKDYPAAVILLQTDRDVASGDPMAGIKDITYPDGTFNIKGISSGKYTLKIFSRGYATKVVSLNVSEGVNNIGELQLIKGAKVSGTIKTESGLKVSRDDVKAVVASDKNFSKMVIGFVDYNPVTLEVEGYEIDGLENGVTYYLIIVPEDPNFLIIDPKPLVMPGSTNIRNLIYKKPKPHFEVKSYKFKNIVKDYVNKWIQFFEVNDLNIISSMPQETWATHLFIAQLLQGQNIDVNTLSEQNIFDLYLIFGFITQPVIGEKVDELVSVVSASGALIPFYLSDTKKQFVLGYVPKGEDNNRGYFEFKFSAVSFYGEKGEEIYRFYLGEDAKVEKVIIPLTGGYAYIGEEDDSGLEVPAGTEFEGVDVSTEAKIIITKLKEETLSAAVLGKLSPKIFSTKLPSSSLSYPGELVSSVYDMKIQLISGPLAVLAKNNKVRLNVKLTEDVTQEDINMLKLGYFNESSNKWEIEDVPLEIDLVNKIASAEVTHLSRFAIFKVKISTVQPYSGEFKTYAYPNPVKGVDKFNIRYCLPGSGKVKVNIKIYNIAGELVRTLQEQEVDAGYIYNVENIELTNDKGENLASGVYFYYIKAGDYKKTYKFAIIR